MKIKSFIGFVVAMSMTCVSLAQTAGARPSTAPAAASKAQRPNFVFFLGEGQGWSSTSVVMDERLLDAAPVPGLTPNLEQLAADGARFSDFYVSAPRCTPARASFFTGIGAAKLHMTYVNEGGGERRGEQGGGGGAGGRGGGGRRGADAGEGEALPAREPLILRMLAPPSDKEMPQEVRTTAEVLREAGYASAHFGKWHVGRLNPRVHGFETNDGPNSNVGPGNNREPNPEEGIAITDRGMAFLTEQVKAGKPFFVQMSHYGAGRESEVTPESLAEVRELLEKGGMRAAREKELVRLAAIRDMDKAIGRVMAKLRELGVADNTVIAFSTDHGSPGGTGGGRATSANPPLAGGKGSVREGGIRVPFIITGPGIKPGVTSSVRATCMDLLPTFADMAGVPVMVAAAERDALTGVEGGSLVDVLKGSEQASVKRSREEICIHFPHYDLGNGGPASAIYMGPYKFMRNDDTGRRYLFNVDTDASEQKDLAAEMPERAAEMEGKLDAYLKAINAPMAKPNPAASGHDAVKDAVKDAAPATPAARSRRGGGGGSPRTN